MDCLAEMLFNAISIYLVALCCLIAMQLERAHVTDEAPRMVAHSTVIQLEQYSAYQSSELPFAFTPVDPTRSERCRFAVMKLRVKMIL